MIIYDSYTGESPLRLQASACGGLVATYRLGGIFHLGGNNEHNQ
jgi:hypothetical protein